MYGIILNIIKILSRLMITPKLRKWLEMAVTESLKKCEMLMGMTAGKEAEKDERLFWRASLYHYLMRNAKLGYDRIQESDIMKRRDQEEVDRIVAEFMAELMTWYNQGEKHWTI